MLRQISGLILCLCLTSLGYSQTIYPGKYSPPNDPELKNLVWNKWNTNNFTILSIDQDQGEYLYKNIEAIKTWSITRWGFDDIKYSAECRVFCVPNKSLMKKLFGRETPVAEVMYDENNKIKLSGIWLVFDGQPIDSIPAQLVLVNLKEIEQTTGNKFNFWFYRGSFVLNHSVQSIKGLLNNGTIGFENKSLLSTTESQWAELDQDKKNQFDFQSACLCLLLRKEYGQKNMTNFVKNPDPKAVIGFKTDDEFGLTCIRFSSNLVADIKNGRTPDDYLIIKR